MREYGLYIDGKFAPAASGETAGSIDPSSGEVVALVAKGARRDARRAVDAARRAFDDGVWSRRSPEQRRDALLGVCDRLWERQAEIADLEARDAGLPIRTATVMIAAAIQHARELIGIATRLQGTTRVPEPSFPKPARATIVLDPFGVASAIVPFNAPFVLAAWKIFPALAMGNTVVLKPSPHTPCSALETAIAFADADVPPGVFNVVTGGADVGEELVTNPFVDRVAFTGSTEVGRKIAALAAPTVKRVTLELGGKSANVLLDDADLDVALPGALWAAFLQSGQTCQAGTRLLVPSRLHDEVVDRLVASVAQLRVGPTTSWDSDLGPLVSAEQLERAQRYVRIGIDEGASLACGGHRLVDEGLAGGFFHAPTIFAGVRDDMRIAQEEIFGPVLSVIRYDGDDHAVRIANGTIYGLTAGVWSRDEERATALARRIDAGTVWINDYHVLTPGAPYGGHRQSGLGVELGEEGCLSFAQPKHIWVGEGDLRARPWTPVIGLDRVYGVTYE